MWTHNDFATRTSLTLALLLNIVSTVAGKDHFLTIGGGYDPTGNQMSLESNVFLIQRVLADERPDNPDHDIFFADGNDPNRDLQYLDTEQANDCSKAVRILTELFGDPEAVGRSYRTHKVPYVIGPTERAAIRRRFRELGRQLKGGDRLIVYVTGHGGEAEVESDDDYDYQYDYEQEKWVARSTDGESAIEANLHNTSIYLWDSDPVEAREFGRWLDQLESDVTVVLVMVQCYSGGFSHVIFQRHSTELGLSQSRRCGFFSQVHDRAAAGCTAESNEASYQEYSTYFWAALGGKTRTGQEIERPDYDNDGKVSFAEAHAYAVIESDTIDIPVRTSDAFLRHYSQLGRQGTAHRAGDAEGKNPVSRLLGIFRSGKSHSKNVLVDASGPVAAFLASSRDDQRAILKLLPQKMGLAEPVTVEAVRLKLLQAESDVAAAATKIEAVNETRRELKSELREDVYTLWPELESGFSPTIVKLSTERSNEFVEAVEALATYQAWITARSREEELSEELLAAQCLEARVQRLLRTIDTVVLATNLSAVSPTEIVERYRQLISLEEQTLVESQ